MVPPTTVSSKTFSKLGNDSYKLVTQKMRWDEARRQCQADDSDLASILSPVSQAYITLQVSKHKEPVWIGLNSNEVRAMPFIVYDNFKHSSSSSFHLLMPSIFFQTGGRYKWVDNWMLSYTKWGANEPKDNFACIYVDVDKKWKTGSCTNTYYSLCKRSPGQTNSLLLTMFYILLITIH